MRKLKIASLNLGYNVMSNIVDGSEASFVQICQSKDGGWHFEHEISSCSSRAADFLTGYDLFGLQEMNLEHQEEFENYINRKVRRNKKYNFETSHYLKKCGVTVGYDPKVMGEGIVITPINFTFGDPNIGRGMIAVWFPKHKLLFINLHAPHHIDLIEELKLPSKQIENLFRYQIGPIFKIDRIIMVGDFNDATSSLLGKEIPFLNKMIRIPEKSKGKKSRVPKTCCTPDNYRFVGDYIMDSKKINCYFGHPIGYVRDRDAFSDHDPIVMIEK